MPVTIALKQVKLPDFGMSEELVQIPAEEFEKRISAAIQQMKEEKIDVLLVFADREHSANLAYLTNLDPRFEEGLLLLDKNGKRKMLLGNENIGYTGIVPIPMEYELYQEFSFMGQDRSRSRSLEELFATFGIGKGMTVGCCYYKYFSADKKFLDLPAYMVDVLRKLTGDATTVINASGIFMDNEKGLRHRNCLEELVCFEWASTRTSESMKKMIRQIRVGVREYELSANYISDGLPLSCHPMVSSGEKARMGLSSPSHKKVALKDPFTSAFGVWGALTARAGMVAENGEQLNKNVAAFYEKFWKNYFHCVVIWYETIGIGVSADDVVKRVEAIKDNSIFDFALNPGHTLHLDEWVNSPFTNDSKVKLYSGMALQADIIPVSKGEFVCANMEDGVVLADEQLRNEWSKRFPESWKRIEARRDFMKNKIGIKLKPEVLPLSNIPAYFSPYLLSADKVAVITG